jgi:hypothetical protein
MQKTPAGKYYDGLYWRHVREVIEILSSHPEHQEVLLQAIQVFIPELEALLDNKGDTVYITSEHVETLGMELDWFASMGGSSLREDIKKERQRFPLDHFVGMTLSEAWGFINSKWTPDMVVQPAATPAATVQPPPIPELVLDQDLVPDSDGKWAYYVHNGVYLEYPTSYNFQRWEQSMSTSVIFLPSQAVLEQGNLYSIKVEIWNIPVDGKARLDPADYLYFTESPIWERMVQNGEFEGTEYIAIVPNGPNKPVMYFGRILYNQESQLQVHVHVNTHVNAIPLLHEGMDYFTLINQRYEYFQHLVDHIRIEAP